MLPNRRSSRARTDARTEARTPPRTGGARTDARRLHERRARGLLRAAPPVCYLTNPLDAHANAPQLLIVENDVDIRTGLAEVLADEGYVVATASDGEEGLAAARARPPDLVVLDLMMPVMDGFEFLQRWNAEPSLAAVPVIVLTARRPVNVPGREIVYKPFDLGVLLGAVARRLGRTGDDAAPAAAR
jgi:two-component system chemotaxis response regulator CheY